jgi:hypothetical protein
MKSMKLTAIVLLTFMSAAVLAGKDCKDKIRNADIFTPEQIEMKIQYCESIKVIRKELKVTFTAEQKAIKKNESLSKEEKKSQLQATFDGNQ